MCWRGFCCLGYCCDCIGLAIRLVSLLALGTIVYFVFGTLGVLVNEFSDVDWHGNGTSTVLASRGWVMVMDAWRRWSFPEPFLRWGWIAVGVYTLIVVVYGIIHCHLIARQCSDRVARIGRDHDDNDSGADDPDRDHAAYALQQLRTTYPHQTFSLSGENREYVVRLQLRGEQDQEVHTD
jgi:hypothetical protein